MSLHSSCSLVYCRRSLQLLVNRIFCRYTYTAGQIGLSCLGSSTLFGKSPGLNLIVPFSSQKTPLQRQRDDSTFGRIVTVPNVLCAFRMGITPLIGYLVVNQFFASACSLFVVAGLTDLADGYIARNVRGQSSLLGSVIDPLADKVLVTTMFLALTYVNLIPFLLMFLVILRDVFLIIGALVKRYRIVTPPVTLKRFFNPAVSPVRVLPTFISKVNTALQLSVVALSLASPVFGFVNHPALTFLFGATGVTTVASGLQYVFLDRLKRF